MRIAFSVSSLEPGRDGVGDYTRRLAGEIIRQGHQCQLVALNERRQTKAVSSLYEMQQSGGSDMECLRLPSSLEWPERVTMARQWLEAFNPDWVSLQFVPFGFHPKGLCFGLGKKLASINSKAPWHIMFHELWLGLGERSPVKHRVWGSLQRSIVRDFLRRLRPKVVHTQAEPYRRILEREGIKASILPLFSNIPLVAGNGWEGLLEPLLTQQTGKNEARTKLYLAGVFGAVHPEWNAEQAVNLLLPLVQRFQKRLVLVFLGRSNLSPATFSRLKSRMQNRAEIVIAGERPVTEVSRILQTLDLGLATTPCQMIQKSGSVSAMVEHGLPVLATRDDWRMRGADFSFEKKSSRLLTMEQFALFETLPTRNPEPSRDCGVMQVAGQMLKALNFSRSLLSSQES